MMGGEPEQLPRFARGTEETRRLDRDTVGAEHSGDDVDTILPGPSQHLQRIEEVEIGVGGRQVIRSTDVGRATIISDQLDNAFPASLRFYPDWVGSACVGTGFAALDRLVLGLLFPLDTALGPDRCVLLAS